MMLTDLLYNLILDLLRTLLLEELSTHVRKKVYLMTARRERRRRVQLRKLLQVRQRNRLIHKLATGQAQ